MVHVNLYNFVAMISPIFNVFILFVRNYTGVMFTSAPQRNDLVKHVCSQIATKCYLVGERLGLHKDVLDGIKKKYQANSLGASYEIVMHWLFEGDDPTWKNLLTVLISDEVGEYTLAQFLSEKFVPRSD